MRKGPHVYLDCDPATLALVGFEDWFPDSSGEKGRFLPNPARLILERAKESPRAWLEASGARSLTTTLLPVPANGELGVDLGIFKRAVEEFLKSLPEDAVVLGLGQGHLIQAPVRVEMEAVNSFFLRREDSLPVVSDDHIKLSYVDSVRKRLEACLQVPDLSGKMELSTNAGRYYCNAFLYLLECLPGRWFAHLPMFLQGYEAQATSFWSQYQGFLTEKYPEKGPQDISFGNTEEQTRLLQAFLRAVRGGAIG